LPQAHLHCWVTKDFLTKAAQVFTAWGFEVKGEIVWLKTTKDGETIQMGAGHYWRTSHESCLLGVRGNLTARQKNLRSVVLAPRGTHSEKTRHGPRSD
jgi:N6-adenosine-specific RNA methylase IME4